MHLKLYVINDFSDCSMYSEKANDQQGFSKEICRSMVAMLDVDYSGKLEFEEFKILFNEVTKWKVSSIWKKTELLSK